MYIDDKKVIECLVDVFLNLGSAGQSEFIKYIAVKMTKSDFESFMYGCAHKKEARRFFKAAKNFQHLFSDLKV